MTRPDAPEQDEDLRLLLPNRDLERLAPAIGRRLLDVERLFSLDLDQFTDHGLRDPADYFRRNVGPTRFVFEGGFSLAFTDWSEQLSVILLPGPFRADTGQQLHRLSSLPDPLRRVIGATCSDVRIWTCREAVESEEAGQCAVSFALAGREAGEVIYCTWLHGDMDADYVLDVGEVDPERVRSVVSIRTGEVVGRGPGVAQRIEAAAAAFAPDYGRQASHAALLKEYLRRTALWAKALDRRADWPSLDVAALLFPDRFSPGDVRLPELGGAFREPLEAAVHFAAVADTTTVRAFGLPDPYEPVVRLLERGGPLTTEHGMIFAGTAGMSRGAFPPAVAAGPGIALDEVALDAIDLADGHYSP